MRPFDVSTLLFVCLTGRSLAAQSPLRPPPQPPAGSYQSFKSKEHPHSIRVIEQDGFVCDACVKQYTGWLDIGPRHLFFWYFESRTSPEEDPLLLWLNGGPGESSLLGLFQENGPCLISEHGNGSVHNEFGWNRNANLLYVDQPANVGFSYVDDPNRIVGDSWTAAKDMHIFLQIFVSEVFPTLQKRDLHISGREYAGHYIPILGTHIIAQNEKQPSATQLNLKSIVVGNGWFYYVYHIFGDWETLCTKNTGLDNQIFSPAMCDRMAPYLPACMKSFWDCQADPDRQTCVQKSEPCAKYNWYIISWKIIERGNQWDIRKPCVQDQLGYCGPIEQVIASYLDRDDVRKALEIPRLLRRWNNPSHDVQMAFAFNAESMNNTLPHVVKLLEHGVDVMMYQGNFDLYLNTAGNYKLANDMLWEGQADFYSRSPSAWHLPNGTVAGWFKEVITRNNIGGPKTRFSFVTVSDAGHFVPQDNPPAALELLTRWLLRRPFD